MLGERRHRVQSRSRKMREKRERGGGAVLRHLGYTKSRLNTPHPHYRPLAYPRAFHKRLEMKGTHFVGLTVIPGGSRRTADVEKIGEKLRLSPYCCCCLPLQCAQLPCIIDDSRQNVRECSASGFFS